jgi:hypothetical protein
MVRQLGDPEVEDLHFIPFGDHDVRGLDVAMNDSFIMGTGQPLTNQHRDPDGLGWFEGTSPNPGEQGLPRAVRHADEQLPVVRLVDLVDRTHVGVIESGGRSGLSHKTFPTVVVVGHLGRKEFQGDDALESRVLGFVNNSHAPLSDLPEKTVPADDLGRVGRGWRAARLRRIGSRRLVSHLVHSAWPEGGSL